jgi:acyl transferase domain-containing protein/thioesterase domain-containing protein
MKELEINSDGTSIAVIGMGGRFPGARNLDEFWRNLRDGVESISRLSDDDLLAAGADRRDLSNPNYVKAAAVLDGVDRFDAGFFGFSPKDASIMDPQHRHFLECAWEALENAGWSTDEFPGRIGVYAGSGMNSYLIHNLLTNPELVSSAGIFLLKQTGNDKDVLSTRVSYQLGLTGPSIAVQTACSTSLVAIHLACQSLLNHECDLALAGGVTIEIPHGLGYVFREGEILSRDGHCRAFDAEASGTIFGSGVGLVALRRLEDALRDGDCIRAVVRATAINNDGARKAGFLAPSVAGQVEVVREALAVAGLDARSIAYVETHGTGTRVGDPIEIEALTRAFRSSTQETGFCAIGSLKTSVGHLDAAAGVAGFIKAVLALEHRQLPASLNYSRPNPLIDFANSPFFVNTVLRDWEKSAQPRRAGVTSLGIGGTNAHVILEEAPAPEVGGESRPWQLLTLSGKTASAAASIARNLADHLSDHPLNLADVAFTLHLGRKAFAHRFSCVCRNSDEADAALRGHDARAINSDLQPERARPVAFLFSGQGAQYSGMARELYETEPDFRATVDSCAEFLQRDLGLDLRTVLYPADDAEKDGRGLIDETRITQPALFTIEYALARLWMSWGIRPNAMIGHSIGEFAAACVAGVFPLQTALRIVAERGRLMQSAPPGTMTAVALSEKELVPLLGDQISLSAVNADLQCVVGGPTEAVELFEKSLTAKGVGWRRLRVSHAFHSAMMDSILEPFVDFLSKLEYAAPQIPYVSSATGKWITDAEATDPRYWARQLRNPVRWADGLSELLLNPDALLIEIGPGATLSSLAAQHEQFKPTHRVIASMRARQDSSSDVEVLLRSLGQVWCAGQKVDWKAFHGSEVRRRVQLPSYPFERQRYWIEPGRSLPIPAPMLNGHQTQIPEIPAFYRPVWQRKDLEVETQARPAGTWLIFKDSGRLGTCLGDHLRQRGEKCVLVSPGDRFARVGEDEYTIEAGNPHNYSSLIGELLDSGRPPGTIVHLWSIAEHDDSYDALGELKLWESRSFYSLLYLAKALGASDIDSNVDIGVVSNRLHGINGGEAWRPERALLRGPCLTIGKEFSNLHCVAIDVDLSPGPHQAQSIDSEALIESARQIIDELRARPAHSVVAYRNHRRWIESFEPAHLAQDQNLPLRERGVYLITGGLGGIGSVLAETLARAAHARLILLGRSPIPHKDRWDEWLHDHETADPVSRKIRSIRAIESAGGEVLVATADVTDSQAMQSLLAQVHECWGPINGVVHCAGVLSDAPILKKDTEGASRVLAPKVRGTLVLDSVLRNEPLDFFLLMSSVSSRLAPAGQVDYAAGNAFLDAFAQARSRGGKRRVTSIGWPRWREVGMAAAFTPSASKVDHPLLDERAMVTQSEFEFSKVFDLKNDWIVRDHRLKVGVGLFPGAGYVEMVRAAVASLTDSKTVAMRNLSFISPIRVAPDSEQPVRLILRKEGEGWRFSALTKSQGGEWVKCATGEVLTKESDAPAPVDIKKIQLRCRIQSKSFDYDHQNETQGRHLDFGPRWRILRKMNVGDREALSMIELPREFASDLSDYFIHPAILDMAAGSAMLLIDGYEQINRLYIPVSYGSIDIRGALPARCYSHIRLRNTPDYPQMVVVDITIFDGNGTAVVDIGELAFRQIGDDRILESEPSAARESSNGVGLGQNRSDGGESNLESSDSISPTEGAVLFRRILKETSLPNVIVFPSDWPAYVARLSPPNVTRAGTLSGVSVKGSLDGEVEETLGRWWKELLGLEQVGNQIDFFDAGGQSLTATRLLAKIRQTYRVAISPATLLATPTIQKLARLIDAGISPQATSSVAAIRREGRNPPLYLVHGIHGSAVMLSDLVRHLETDRPVYAVQYDLLGLEPASKLESIAARQVAEIRAIQPAGPYNLLGYSFGGVLAFEIARQLRAVGEPVAFVGLLDTLSPRHDLDRNGEDTRLGRAIDRTAWVRDQFQRMVTDGRRLDYLTQRLRWRSLAAVYALFARVGKPLPRWLRMEDVLEQYVISQYRIRPYPGRIILYRASDGFSTYDGNFQDDLGWRRAALEGLEVCEVPGKHLDMIREPNVRILADEITTRLARFPSEDLQQRPGPQTPDPSQPPHALAMNGGSPSAIS